MSHLTYQNSLTSNTLPTPSIHHSSSHTSLTMMRSIQPENCTNQAQLKVTDAKLIKSYNSDSNLKLGNHNMKLNGKVMNTKTIAGSMLKILMSSLTQITGFIVINHIPISSENLVNPHKQDVKEKKHLDKFMNKDSKSCEESTLTMRSQNSLHKLCFPLLWMIKLTEVKHTSESQSDREVMCRPIGNFPAHYLKKEECKELTYRVYSLCHHLTRLP